MKNLDSQKITFRKAIKSDEKLLKSWFNKSHVKEFWDNSDEMWGYKLISSGYDLPDVDSRSHIADYIIDNYIAKNADEAVQERLEEQKKKLGDTTNPETKENKRHTPDQGALSDLAKESGRKGISNQDADTLLEWSEEYDFRARDDRGKPPHWVGENIFI